MTTTKNNVNQSEKKKTIRSAEKNISRTQLSIFLTQCRKQIDMSLPDVAEATGISESYLRKLENGEMGNPSLEVAIRLSKLYGVDLNSLASHLIDDIDRKLDLEIRRYEKIVPVVKWAGGDISILSYKDKVLYLKFLKGLAVSMNSSSNLTYG